MKPHKLAVVGECQAAAASRVCCCCIKHGLFLWQGWQRVRWYARGLHALQLQQLADRHTLQGGRWWL